MAIWNGAVRDCVHQAGPQAVRPPGGTQGHGWPVNVH
jgi:hypothetical protein